MRSPDVVHTDGCAWWVVPAAAGVTEGVPAGVARGDEDEVVSVGGDDWAVGVLVVVIAGFVLALGAGVTVDPPPQAVRASSAVATISLAGVMGASSLISRIHASSETHGAFKHWPSISR